MTAAGGSAREPVAIIGMACRFPKAHDLESFWQVQHDAVDAVTEVPPDRWDAGRFYDPYLSQPGTMSTRWGGFLTDIDAFDAAFFGISDAEAMTMDPQHRLLLETGWHAVEDAALPPCALRGAAGGVFMGISGSEFGRSCMASPESVNAYTAMGNAPSLAVNRLSRCFGFTGPSLGVDTGCSSSLVAVHLACQSLQSGESGLALAGGVNVVLAPETAVALSSAWMLSSSGRCKSFDADADGYTRGEGCGVVVLKRLADAVRDGDPIRAVILGTAVGYGGADASIPAGLRRVAEAALANAGLTRDDVGFIEAHAVGAAAADREELSALAEFLARRTVGEPCVIGSVKTNIGHLEAAAGVAGLIRTVLVLERECIPPLLHLNTPIGPDASAGGNLALARRLTPWPRGANRRVAGVNSSGLGGANAHVLVAEAPARAAPRSQRGSGMLFLSAKSRDALRRMAGRYAEFLRSHPDVNLSDVCHTAAAARARFDHSVSIAAVDTGDAVRLLERFRDTGEAGTSDEPVVCAGRRIALPGYPFERKRHWPARPSNTAHAVLQRISSPALSGAVFETVLDPDMAPIGGHRVHGTRVAAGPLIAGLMHSGAEMQMGTCSLARLEFLRPLLFESSGSRIVQLVFDHRENCRVYSRSSEVQSPWILHAQSRCERWQAPGQGSAPAVPARFTDRISGDDFYACCRASGIDLAPAVRVSVEFERSSAGCRSRLAPIADRPSRGQTVGTVAQAAVELLAFAARGPLQHPWIPVSIERVQVFSETAPVCGYGVLAGAPDEEIYGHAWFWDSREVLTAEVRGLRLRAAPSSLFRAGLATEQARAADPSLEASVRSIRTADPRRRGELLASLLQEQIASLLGPERARGFTANTGFFDLGIDSLMLVELRNRLQQALGRDVELPISVLFSNPTAEALAAHVARELWGHEPAPDEVEAEVLALSEETLDRSLEAFDEWSQAER